MQRDNFLTQRYPMWGIVWLVYVTVDARSGDGALVPGGAGEASVKVAP